MRRTPNGRFSSSTLAPRIASSVRCTRASSSHCVATALTRPIMSNTTRKPKPTSASESRTIPSTQSVAPSAKCTALYAASGRIAQGSGCVRAAAVQTSARLGAADCDGTRAYEPDSAYVFDAVRAGHEDHAADVARASDTLRVRSGESSCVMSSDGA